MNSSEIPAINRALIQVECLLDTAILIAEKAVEAEARRILSQYPYLGEFVMAMGGWSFYLKEYPTMSWNTNNLWDTISIGDEDEGEEVVEYVCPMGIEAFSKFLDTLDDWLKIKGSPMRFTKDSPLRTR
jgi:hypothetical protein